MKIKTEPAHWSAGASGNASQTSQLRQQCTSQTSSSKSVGDLAPIPN